MEEIFFHTIKVNEVNISFSSTKRSLTFEEYVEVYEYFLSQMKG